MSQRLTRSSSRLAAAASASSSTALPLPLPPSPSPSAPKPRKRKAPSTPTTTSKLPKPSVAAAAAAPAGEPAPLEVFPTLSFDLAEAKAHLIAADRRFAGIFENVPCKPFEVGLDEALNPHRTLCTSIIGQQVSWLAARSIKHRFVRHFFPSAGLPEKVPPVGESNPADALFPTPGQVMKCSVPELKALGLSTRKAEYVLDLSQKFHSGELTATHLASAPDEEVMRTLCAVRGIGKWTVEMFMMFSLRRPDVLPVGDLGLQKGLLRWASGATLKRSAAPPNVGTASTPGPAARPPPPTPGSPTSSPASVPLPSPAPPAAGPSTPRPSRLASALEAAASATPAPPTIAGAAAPATPAQTQNAAIEQAKDFPLSPAALETGLSPAVLKARASKKLKSGAYLSPKECEALTEGWKPYRSLGVYYMWALAGDED